MSEILSRRFDDITTSEFEPLVNSFIDFVNGNTSTDQILQQLIALNIEYDPNGKLPPVLEQGNRSYFAKSTNEDGKIIILPAYVLKTSQGNQLHFDDAVDPVVATNQFIEYLSLNPQVEARGLTTTVNLRALEVLYGMINKPEIFETMFIPFFGDLIGSKSERIKIGKISNVTYLHDIGIEILVNAEDKEIKTIVTYRDLVGELLRAIHPNPLEVGNKKIEKVLKRFSLTFQSVKTVEG